MNQHELNENIARLTGESIQTIAAMGFSVLVEPPPLVLVDHRLRLSDLTRRRVNRRRDPAKPRSRGSAGSSAKAASRRRSAARVPEWTDRILPMPNIRKLTFDKWGA